MRQTACPLLLLCAALTATGANAQQLAYVEATSELDNGRPASYVYNLVDGKPGTAWCSKPGDEPQTIVFGFKKRQKVTHISLIVGALKGDALNKKKSRVSTIALSDGAVRREISFKDEPGMQEVKLDPPIEGRRLLIDITAIKAGTKSKAPVCIGEVLFRKGKKELTGQEIHKAMRGLNTPSRRLLHSWVDEPSAPERTLIFALDGTFTYSFEPLMDGKPVKLKGKWRAVGKKVTFEVRRKKTKMKTRLTRIDDGERQTMELSLSGDGPDATLNAAFRQAPIRYE